MDVITVEKRDPAAKAKQLRRSGIVPCVVYGRALEESISVQMDQGAAERLLRQKRLGSRLQLMLDGRSIPVQIKDKSRGFVDDEIVHIGFQALQEDARTNSVIHLVLQNVDKVAGILEKLLLEIPYSSLPGDMIDTIDVDLDGLPVGTVLTVADIPELMGDKIELQVEPSSIVLRISDKKRGSLRLAEDTAE